MKSVGCALLLGLGFSLAAQAGGIYKCTKGTEIAYQSWPCAEGLREDPIAPVAFAASAQNDTIKQQTQTPGSTIGPGQSKLRPNMPFQRTVLSVA